MNTISAIMLVTAACNLFLGIFVYVNGPSKRLNRWYGIFGVVTSLWVLANFMIGIFPIVFWIYTVYALGALIPAFSLMWILDLCEQKLNRIKVAFIWFFALVFFIIPYISGNLFLSNVEGVYAGKIEGDYGFLFLLYSLYMFSILFFAGYILIQRYRSVKGIQKTQLSFVASGAVAWIVIVLIVSFIIPLFNVFDYTALDAPASLIFLTLTAYAVTRYHFFNIKVIATELFVFALWIFIIIRALLSESFPDLLVNGSLFFATIIIGILLIRSVMKEVRQTEHIRALMKMKEEFMQTASHQLRTPVTVIKGTLDALRDGDLDTLTPEKRKTYLDRAYIKAEKLNSIITDILSATEMDDPEFSMTGTLRPIDIKQMVVRSVDSHEQLAQGKGIKLVFKDTGDVPLVNGSEQFLPEVIDNYISNAIQYTPKGGTITVRVFEEYGFVVCTVSDTGIGVPPEDMEKLWEKFIRAKNANDAHTDGSGLGLFIVKRIVEGHPRGEVFVESKLGEGSTFGFKLLVAKNTA